MVFLYPALASSIVRAKQAQLGPLDGRGFETPRVQNTLLPNPSEGSAPSLRAAASESASCRRLGVTQAACPRAARRTSLAYASLLPNPSPNPSLWAVAGREALVRCFTATQVGKSRGMGYGITATE